MTFIKTKRDLTGDFCGVNYKPHMKKEISTAITINATPQKIWSILMDFEAYPKWNPFIKNISGNRVQGGKLKVKIHPSEGKAMQFNPEVKSLIEHKEFSWLGKLLIRGLFDGHHIFELQPNEDGSVHFIQREKFSGLLVSMIDLSKTEQGFREMNEKLKELAENLG